MELSRIPSQEAAARFTDTLIEYTMGTDTFASQDMQASLPVLRNLCKQIPVSEQRMLLEDLKRVTTHSTALNLSEEAAEALLEIVMHPADKRASFLRFLKVAHPDIYTEASKPGGILVNLLPSDIPWAVYREYLVSRHLADVRRKEEMNRSRACVESIEEYVAHVREQVYAESRQRGPVSIEWKNELVLLDALAYARRVNEGMNGVIFELRIEDLPSEDREIALDSGIFGQAATLSAVKVLKVYQAEAAAREYKNHQLVGDVLRDASAQGSVVASVPDLHVLHTMTFPNTDLRDAYRQLTRIPTLESRVSCISMEFVQGEDLGTYIWRHYGQALIRRVMALDVAGITGVGRHSLKVLETSSTYHHIREIVDDLQKRIVVLPEARHLLLEPAPQPRNDGERLKFFQASERNMKRIISLLQSDGFTIDYSIYKTIESTIEACRSAGIILLDCHERNIMITPDGGVVFIDFEKIKQLRRPIISDADDEAFYDMEMNPGGLPVDKGVLSVLRPLIKTKA